MIKDIRDPEKPFTLEELGIITEDSIQIIGKLFFLFWFMKKSWFSLLEKTFLLINVYLRVSK